MLEFLGQVLEFSVPVGRGTKGPPRPPVCPVIDGLSKFEGSLEGPFWYYKLFWM